MPAGRLWRSITVADCGEAWCSAAAELPAMPRHDPFGTYAAREAGLFEVADATLDPRFRGSEWVTGAPAIRSYAGCALRGADGASLGTLAVYDTAPRAFTSEQRTALLLLAEQAIAQVELQLTAGRSCSPSLGGVPPTAMALLDSAPVAIYHTDAAGNMTYANPEYRRMFGLDIGHGPDAWSERVFPADRTRMEQAWAEFCNHPVPSRFDGYRTRADDGSVRHFSEQVVATAGGPRLGRHDQRFYRPRGRPRQSAQGRNTVQQYLRSGAHRHRLCRSQRQAPALQSGILDHAGLRAHRSHESHHRRSDPRRRHQRG